MRSVEVSIPRVSSDRFVEGPTGYYSVVNIMVEDPVDSGLYIIDGNLFVESPAGSGLYVINAEFLGANQVPIRNIRNFSVQEDATPIHPADSSGGVGRITFDINESRDTRMMVGQVTLVDGSLGKTSGTVKSVANQNGLVSVVSDSILGLLNTDRIVAPYIGTLAGAVQHYCDIVGITNDVTVESSLASRPVVYPGWSGNVWVALKELLVKEQAEIAQVFDRIYVRPLRTLEANLNNQISSGWNVDSNGAARAIEIYYYNHQHASQGEIYPLTTEEPTIYQVDAGETVTFTQQLNASVISVNQPTATNFVENRTYEDTNGVYAVVGNDGLPVQASQWTGQGGNVEVRVTDDPSVVEIVITGASMEEYAPYRIAMSSGSSNFYNALHITADAVMWNKKSVVIPTGAVNVTTSDEIGTTIDNRFISTLGQAHSLGTRSAQAFAGINHTLSGSAVGINRTGTGRELIQPTIMDFNGEVAAGTTIATFNAEWAGQSIASFNAYWQQQVDSLFANQLFGNGIGARIRDVDGYFRITTATTSPQEIQYSAVADTLISDFNAVQVGNTISDFNAQFVGYTCREFSIVPLRRD